MPAIEVMVCTSRIRDFILDPDQTLIIGDAIKEGDFYGMQTFDQALLSLYEEGLITLRRRGAGGQQPARLQAARAVAGPRREPHDVLRPRGPATDDDRRGGLHGRPARRSRCRRAALPRAAPLS